MYLNNKSLEKLRDLINEETEYRSGPKLVSFFNSLGFNDYYQQGFPSRWVYTDEKLKLINGKLQLDICIKNIFNPVNFISRFSELNKLIDNFNQYLAFDGWKVVRSNKDITFAKADKIDFNEKVENKDSSEEDFIKKEFDNIDINKLNLDSVVISILEKRIKEIKSILKEESPLASIFMIGSVLEGIFYGIASGRMKEVNTAKAAPRDKGTGEILKFDKWKLNNYIDVFYELRLIEEDVKKFSHVVRDFRNYIHPYRQMASRFDPSKRTAEICWKVLLAVIEDLSNKKPQM